MKVGDFVDITLYNCTAESERLDKTNFLGTGLEITGAAVKGVFTVDAPEFVLTYPGDLSGYNYAKIGVDGTDYYYYCSISGDIGQQLRARCRRDPLMSFRNEIRALPVYAVRAEQNATENNQCGYNTYLHDSMIQKTAREFTIVKIDPHISKFEYPDSALPDARQYILGVIS